VSDRSVRVVVVTYNTRELTIALLADLRNELQDVPHGEVVVVDNASADGTAGQVADRFQDFSLEVLDRNLGFAGAVNLAAVGSNVRWLLLINPDARIDEGAVEHLLTTAEQQPGHGLYGGRTIDVTRGTSEDSVAALPTIASLAAYACGLAPIARRLGWLGRSKRAAKSTVPTEVAALPGPFLLVEKDAWDEVAGFDERYFMYAEDIDLSVRIAATGRRPLYVPSATIRHVGGASSTSGGKEVLRLTSLVTFLRTHWSPARAAVGCNLLLIGIGLRRCTRIFAHTPDGRWETAWRERAGWRAGWPTPRGKPTPKGNE
jgi:N-acetylglucosaminyl-diphospho-decaprenol L-rhamnosyltransferase